MHRASRIFVAGLVAATPACKPEEPRSTGARPAKDYASTRFSALDEINSTNVKNLWTVATFSTGVLRGHEAAPIVVGRTMYIITPFPNYVYALDLTNTYRNGQKIGEETPASGP